MIEINLLPGAAAKAKRRRGPTLPPAFGRLAKIPNLPKIDKAAVYMGLAWLAGLGVIGFLFLSARNNKATLEDQLVTARLDSVRLKDALALIDKNKAREDTLQAKIEVVQRIDADRYIWPHILDEAARAVPAQFLWLVAVTPVPPDTTLPYPKFKLEGRAGNPFVLAQYLDLLEQSPFIRAVKLEKNELVRENEKLVYQFILEASYEPPPPDLIETVPLFGAVEAPPDSTPAGAGRAGGRGAPVTGPPNPPAAGRGAPPRKPGGVEERH